MLQDINIETFNLRSNKNNIKKTLITLENKKTDNSTNIIREFYDNIPDNVSIMDSLIKDGILGKLSFEDFCYLFKDDLYDSEVLDKSYKECNLINKKLTDLLGDYELLWGTV